MNGFARTVVAGAAAVALWLSASSAYAETLRLGTEGAYPPFNAIDSNGELVGFDVDVGDEICRRLETECEWVVSEWEGIIPGLVAQKYDAIVASMSITAKRAKKVDFSQPYYRVSKKFLVCGDTEFADIGPNAMADARIGTQASTTNADYLEALYTGSDIRLYRTMEDSFSDLKAGRIDAVLSNVDAQYDWLQRDGAGCRNIGGEVVSLEHFGPGKGVAVRKGDTELLARIEAALDAMFADGTMKRINDAHLPFSILPEQAAASN